MSQMPSWNSLSRPTFWHSTTDIHFCSNGPAFGQNAYIHPGLLVALGRICCKILCIRLLRTICKMLADFTSGGYVNHHFYVLFFQFQICSPHASTLRWIFCVIISLVVSSHVLMSSARIPMSWFTFFEPVNGTLYFFAWNSGISFLSFFTFGMSVIFLSDLKHDLLLIPLNSSKSPLYLFLSCCSSVWDALFGFYCSILSVGVCLLSQCFVSPQRVVDLIISFTGLFIFTYFLATSPSLRVFLFFSWAAAAFVSSLGLPASAEFVILCCCGACTFIQRVCCCGVRVFTTIACCCCFSNESAFNFLCFYSCGVRVIIRMACCGFRNKSSRSHLHCRLQRVSSFQWNNAVTPASTTPSACFDIVQDPIMFGFCVVRCISASCLNLSFEFGVALFELVCFIGSRFYLHLGSLCSSAV